MLAPQKSPTPIAQTTEARNEHRYCRARRKTLVKLLMLAPSMENSACPWPSLMFALAMTKADQRESGEIGLPLVALEHWLYKPQ